MMLVVNIYIFKICSCGVCSNKENGARSTVRINPRNYLVGLHPTLFRQTPSHVRTNPTSYLVGLNPTLVRQTVTPSHVRTNPKCAVADPKCARGGGVSHILAEKMGVSFTLFKKMHENAIFSPIRGGGGAYAGYTLCWIRHWVWGLFDTDKFNPNMFFNFRARNQWRIQHRD